MDRFSAKIQTNLLLIDVRNDESQPSTASKPTEHFPQNMKGAHAASAAYFDHKEPKQQATPTLEKLFTPEEIQKMITPQRYEPGHLPIYNPVNNGRYPIRNMNGGNIYITKIIADDVKLENDIDQYLQRKEQWGTDGEIEKKIASRYASNLEAVTDEHGKVTAVKANRDMNEGECLGLCGGTIIKSVSDEGDKDLNSCISSMADQEYYISIAPPSENETYPYTLAGDNILAHIPTIYDYDDKGKPIKEAEKTDKRFKLELKPCLVADDKEKQYNMKAVYTTAKITKGETVYIKHNRSVKYITSLVPVPANPGKFIWITLTQEERIAYINTLSLEDQTSLALLYEKITEYPHALQLLLQDREPGKVVELDEFAHQLTQNL